MKRYNWNQPDARRSIYQSPQAHAIEAEFNGFFQRTSEGVWLFVTTHMLTPSQQKELQARLQGLTEQLPPLPKLRGSDGKPYQLTPEEQTSFYMLCEHTALKRVLTFLLNRMRGLLLDNLQEMERHRLDTADVRVNIAKQIDPEMRVLGIPLFACAQDWQKFLEEGEA